MSLIHTPHNPDTPFEELPQDVRITAAVAALSQSSDLVYGIVTAGRDEFLRIARSQFSQFVGTYTSDELRLIYQRLEHKVQRELRTRSALRA